MLNQAKARPSLLLAFRFAIRELRGGLRGFGIFLACIVLGVAAIAAVGSVARGMSDSIAREGQTLLGGDLGCLMNMAGRLKRQGSNVKVFHVAEILANLTDVPSIGAGES